MSVKNRLPLWSQQRASTSSRENTAQQYYNCVPKSLVCWAGSSLLKSKSSPGSSQVVTQSLLSSKDSLKLLGLDPNVIYTNIFIVTGRIIVAGFVKLYKYIGAEC